MPVAANFTPNLLQFKQAARQAVKSGGAVRVNDKGKFIVKGNHWFGKPVLWLKIRLMPARVHAENQRVLYALALSLEGRGFGRGTLENELRALSAGASRKNPAVFTRSLHNALHQVEATIIRREQAQAKSNKTLKTPDVGLFQKVFADKRAMRAHALAHAHAHKHKKTG